MVDSAVMFDTKKKMLNMSPEHRSQEEGARENGCPWPFRAKIVSGQESEMHTNEGNMMKSEYDNVNLAGSDDLSHHARTFDKRQSYLQGRVGDTLGVQSIEQASGADYLDESSKDFIRGPSAALTDEPDMLQQPLPS